MDWIWTQNFIAGESGDRPFTLVAVTSETLVAGSSSSSPATRPPVYEVDPHGVGDVLYVAGQKRVFVCGADPSRL